MSQAALVSATRRLFVWQATLAFAGLVGGVGCGKMRFSCSDVGALTETERTARNKLGYTDQSADPKKQCSGCSQWVAGEANACGRCKVLPGPIHPEGSCSLFTPKA